MSTLRKCCLTENGLVSKELRAKVWPLLLHIDVSKLPKKPKREQVRQHSEFSQVKLDVDRCVSRLPKGMPPDQQNILQENLIDLILHILSRNSELHYYQGYHDIVITILQVCGLKLAIPVAEKLTMYNLKDFMQKTMDSTKHVLNLIFPIIDAIDPELYVFLKQSEVGSYFALSWLITWYGHVMKDLKRTSRIYDFFIASHPVMPMYLAAEIVSYRREEILSTDCDMPSVHHVLTSLASRQSLPDDDLIQNAVMVFCENPPRELIANDIECQFYNELYMAKQNERSTSTYLDSFDKQINFTKNRRNKLLLNAREITKADIPQPHKSSIFRKLFTMSVTGAIGFAVVSFWIQNYANNY